jgi:hypothetical protein
MCRAVSKVNNLLSTGSSTSVFMPLLHYFVPPAYKQVVVELLASTQV